MEGFQSSPPTRIACRCACALIGSCAMTASTLPNPHSRYPRSPDDPVRSPAATRGRYACTAPPHSAPPRSNTPGSRQSCPGRSFPRGRQARGLGLVAGGGRRRREGSGCTVIGTKFRRVAVHHSALLFFPTPEWNDGDFMVTMRRRRPPIGSIGFRPVHPLERL